MNMSKINIRELLGDAGNTHKKQFVCCITLRKHCTTVHSKATQ